MKRIWLSLLLLSLNTPLFSEIIYRQIDSLAVGTSVDLDTMSASVTTGYFLDRNPYRAGTYYNPDFIYDLSISGMGLTWCNCDGIYRQSYFETYSTNLDITTLLKNELDLMDTSAFKMVDTLQSDGRYQLRDTGNYVVKTNKNNFCVVRFDSILTKYIAVCGPAPTDYHNCTQAYRVKIWYQDDGTTNFKCNTAVHSLIQKRNVLFHPSPSYKAYDIKGRIIPYRNGRLNAGAGLVLIGNSVILNIEKNDKAKNSKCK